MTEKTKARILLFSVGAILIIGVLSVYKLYLLNQYNTQIDLSFLENLGEMKVQTNEEIANNTVYDMNLYLKENLEKNELTGDGGFVYKRDNKIDLWISRWNSNIVSDWKEHSDNEEIDFEKLAEKENIKTGYDMFNYLIKHKDDKLSIFSRINKMYMFYWSRNSDSDFDGNNIPEGAGFVSGDLTGYYILGPNFSSVKIYHKDLVYVLKFNKELYSQNDIIQVLNTITFND